MAHTPAGSASAPGAEALTAKPPPAPRQSARQRQTTGVERMALAAAKSSRGRAVGTHDVDDRAVSAHDVDHHDVDQQLTTGEFVALDNDYADDDLVGTTLSHTYLILRVLGEGGMGRVYEAQHTRIASKRFAVKTLHPEFSRRPDVRARFQREAEAAAAINHPNVLGVYDVDVLPDGRPYMVSELLEGQELGKYLDEHQRIDVPMAIAITRQICDALHAAHACGVIHRDVKPENIFLTGDLTAPVAKVLDFGISRLEGQSGNTLTRTGMVMGTPSYMAPEQAKGYRVDHRTDLYATGAILYRALTGKLPFDKNDATATLAAVLTEEPTPPRTHNPALPASLELVIQRAMARDPNDRYQHMDELDIALSMYDTTNVRQPTAIRRTRPGLASETTASAARLMREAQEARPKLVMLGGVAVLASVFGVITTLAGVIRFFRSGPSSEMTGIEALVIAVGAICALATPIVLVARHAVLANWDNTAKVIELYTQWREPLLMGLSASGLMALTALVLESAVLRNSPGLAWPLWGMVIPVVGIASGMATLVAKRADPLGPIGRLAGVRTFAIGSAAVVAFVVLSVALRGMPEVTPTASQAADHVTSASAPDASGAVKPVEQRRSWSPKSEKLLEEIHRYQRQGNTAASIDSLDQLLTLDPGAIHEKELRRLVLDMAVRASFTGGKTAEHMNDLLVNKMGASGPDIMFEIMVTRGGTAAAGSAARMLRDSDILTRGSDAMQVAYALRTAEGCDEKRALFPLVRAGGDQRAMRELTILKSCKRGGCCMAKDDDFKDTVAALKARIKK